MPNIVSLDRLQSQLLTSGLQEKNFPLYQVISQLIGFLRQTIDETAIAISEGGSGGGTTIIQNQIQQLMMLDANDDYGLIIPGPAGIDGIIGKDGTAGPPGMPGDDGEPGDYYLPMPGPQGNQGVTGAGGPVGPMMVPNDGEDGDSAHVLLQNFNNGGAISLYTSQISITDAQIKTLNTTPVQIVAAPDSTHQYIPIRYALIKQTTAGAYSANISIRLRYTGIALDLATVTISLNVADRRWGSAAPVVITADTNNGMGLGLEISGSAGLTGGNAANWLVVQVTYVIITEGP